MTDNAVYDFGEFRLDTRERVLEAAGRPVPIAPKALEVLIVLVRNGGHIVEKEQLIREVWPDTFVEENNLAFNISVLRKLLGESSAAPRYIETVPKRGYRFIAEVAEIPGRAEASPEASPEAREDTGPSLPAAEAGPRDLRWNFRARWIARGCGTS